MEIITHETAEMVRKLGELDWSQRQIARQLHISPATVFRILRGVWHPVEQHDDPLWELKQSAQRCPGCGGLVYHWPCLTCDMRGRAARHVTLERK